MSEDANKPLSNEGIEDLIVESFQPCRAEVRWGSFNSTFLVRFYRDARPHEDSDVKETAEHRDRLFLEAVIRDWKEQLTRYGRLHV